jgi:hypothetical protein
VAGVQQVEGDGIDILFKDKLQFHDIIMGENMVTRAQKERPA